MPIMGGIENLILIMGGGGGGGEGASIKMLINGERKAIKF